MFEENPFGSRGVEASDSHATIVDQVVDTVADSPQIEDHTQPTLLQAPPATLQPPHTSTSTKTSVLTRKASKQQVSDQDTPRKTTPMGNAVYEDRCEQCKDARKGCKFEGDAIDCSECAKRGHHCTNRRIIISDGEDDDDIAVPESPEVLMTDYDFRVPTVSRPKVLTTIAEVVAEDERLERVRIQTAAKAAEAEAEAEALLKKAGLNDELPECVKTQYAAERKKKKAKALLEKAGLNDVSDATWEQSWEPGTLPSGAVNPWATPTDSPFNAAKFFSNTFASLEPKKKAGRSTKNDKRAEPESKSTYPFQIPILCCKNVYAVTENKSEIDEDLENYGKLVGGTYPVKIQTQPNRPYGVIWTDHNTLIGVLKIEVATGKKDINWYGITDRIPTEINHANGIPTVAELKDSLTIHEECFARLGAGVEFECRDHPESVWTMFQVRWQAQGEARRRIIIMNIANATGQDFEELMAADRAKRMHL